MARNPNAIEVGLNEWRKGGKGNILMARHITTAVVVALTNKSTGTGCLGAFTSDGAWVLAQMVQAVLGESTGPAQVLLWYGGGALLPLGDRDAAAVNPQTLRLRKHLMAVAAAERLTRVQGRWLLSRRMLGVSFACGSERFAVRIDRDPGI